MRGEDTYWTEMELRLELMQNLEQTSLRFQDQLRQILLDMRLYHESTDSLLGMIIRLLEGIDTEDCRIFLSNVERVAFDTQLAPRHSDAFIWFLRKMQQNQKAFTKQP